jgi:hypothetical protein
MSDDFPDVKLKAMVTFPANVIGGTGIDVVYQNGNYQLNLNFGELAQITAIPVPALPTTFFALWESTQNTYRRMSVPDLQAQIVTPVLPVVPLPASATPLIESGAGAVGVSLKYAREDHAHPAYGLTDAPSDGTTYGRKNAAWTAVTGGGGGASVLVGDTAPVGATDNSLWWESDSGLLFIKYNDGNSSQFVAVGGSALNGPALPPQGRLTLQSGVPVMTTTQAAKTTLFYTPYNGNFLPIYNGTTMLVRAFAELSCLTTDTIKNPAAVGANAVNDWFVWDDAGTLRLGHGPDWTDDATRSAGTALVRVNGILLNAVAITNGAGAQRGTYVGTTRASSSQLNWQYPTVAAGGGVGLFFVWNMYNRVTVSGMCGDGNNNWTYGSTAWRPADNSANYGVWFVSGVAEDAFAAEYSCTMQAQGSTASYCAIGVALGSPNVVIGTQAFLLNTGSGNISASLLAKGRASFVGARIMQAMEYSLAGTTTFFGNQGAPAITQSGITVDARM